MNKQIIIKIANEIIGDWAGPSGKCWCDELQREVDLDDAAGCGAECEPIDELNDHPPKYLRPKDISW